MMDFDVIVIGAGAAGLFFAGLAAQKAMKVLVLDHREKIGEKIRISGGGRCNFTNIYSQPSNFLSQNPHFAKSALARFTPDDFLKLVQKYGIPYHEKKMGQMFCDHSAQDIIDMLFALCPEQYVTFQLG
ncbi:MAG: NAD(P)/FAD-dependent oxidoreductase, partial [Alphaproteobacteria bacterium]